MIQLHVDMHVHSVFSDGAGTVAENVEAAEAGGLRALGLVDHVRRDTTWVPAYVEEVRKRAGVTPVRLTCGVEAKILDTSGRLDLPTNLAGVDRILAADHQVPTAAGPRRPEDVRARIEAGRLKASDVVDMIVEATTRAMRRHLRLQLAHLFSVLPKVGLSEEAVGDSDLHYLAETAKLTGAILEISERWRCPSLRVACVFHAHDVPIVLSTDSHRPEDVGRYAYGFEVAAALGSGDAVRALAG